MDNAADWKFVGADDDSGTSSVPPGSATGRSVDVKPKAAGMIIAAGVPEMHDTVVNPRFVWLE